MKNLKSIKMNTIKLLAIFFIATLTFSACSDDDHEDDDHDHEEELITTVTYTLTKGNDAVTLVSTDLDGLGGNDATFNIYGPLIANTTYTGVIKLENATEDTAENITEEVEEEGDEHEFFYSSKVSGITINKTDTDTEGNPIGIETTLTTGAAGTGTLTIILKHEPTKPNDNTSTNAGGSTDVEVTFSVTVE